ncbi:MAG: InlB B-repeat-containing protein, partial [Clostridia bacterium]|nr:InlB B-repeat-containing protein [Clostridia bacterium]
MEEYTVVLNEGCQFSMSIFDATKGGSYSLGDDGALTLKPNKEDNQISATLKDNVITLNYNDAEFRFLKKVNYTVKFESNEGSAVNDATVVNGKKVVKPADPSKNGFMFVGWYEDAEFTKPFSFNSYVMTKDTTLYARWVEKQIGKSEFVVEFNAGSEVENPEPKTTIGGRLFDLPVVAREGYTFKGWWYSMSGNDKLTYEFTDGMSLDANSTLIAVWQSNNLGSKLAEPLVSVESNNIKWTSVGAKEYILKVQGPDGNYIVNEALITTARSLNFENHPAGDYTVTLTAVASSEENNAVSTRVYRNKALTRVSQFSVIEPSTLLFNAVENAEKYLITIDCGDKNHNHVNFDNGLSTNFNFADCAMQNSGIKFTVTAVANGFASSVSQKFVYAPKLDAVTEFSLDAGTQVLTWNKVANATGYMVSVKCGNDKHSEEFVNVGAVNSIGLKECSSVAGGIVVKVYPVSKWFVSSEAATYTFDKQNLATPQNIRISGTVVSWDAVSGAESYVVTVAGKSFTTNTNSVDVAGANFIEKEYYTLSVVAKASGAKDSLATDLIDARNLAMAETLKYEGSVLSWTHVFGAVSYDVQVNDGNVFSVSNGANFASIELTQAGENVLKVRFVGDDDTAYEWVTTSVYAHTLTFVSDGGSSVEEQFKAVGDLVVLPEPEKVGYDFLAWYTTPKGPESNGAAVKELRVT